MKNIALSLVLIVCAGCSTTPTVEPEVIKAHKGEETPLTYENLPVHEALEVSFTVHFLGGWDGTSYEPWSPDRFFCKLDAMTLLDSTFNNCHIPFVDNIWQSYPDPYHKGQLDFRNARKSSIDGTFLYHGGHGAAAIATQGFKWSSMPSVDSTYRFSFIIPHDEDSATLLFGTKWKEEPISLATYQLENVKVEPLKKTPRLDSKKEEKAWLTFFSGSPDASQQAWQQIYATHPEKLVERVEDLLAGDLGRREYLLTQLEKGRIPTESLYQEVCLDPVAKDMKQQTHRILCLRELTLGRKFFTPDERHDLWRPTEFTEQTQALRKLCSFGGCSPMRDCAPLQKARMRLSSYMRMINTEESLRLAKKLERF